MRSEGYASRGSVRHCFLSRKGIYYISFCDADGQLYVFGPASADTVSFAQLVAYRKRHTIANQKFQIPCLSFGKVFNAIAIVYYMITGKQITEEDILSENNRYACMNDNIRLEEEAVMTYEIQKSTEENRCLAYRDELKWTAEIENGTRMDTGKKLTAGQLEKLEMIGTFSNKNAFKQYEYMVITTAALACRAAIRGGVNAYDAYLLADVFFQKASLCTNVMELLHLYTEIADEFSSKVRKARENQSPDLIEQCRDYIARHRTRKFSLPSLAAELKRNPSYLSRVFSEQTGKTLQEYALEQRLDAGANLLRYSDSSVGEIAGYLSFSSQSYFGEQFKKQFGQSPAEYRKLHKIRDFKE